MLQEKEAKSGWGGSFGGSDEGAGLGSVLEEEGMRGKARMGWHGACWDDDMEQLDGCRGPTQDREGERESDKGWRRERDERARKRLAKPRRNGKDGALEGGT